ncbi:hypothetical protein, partial [Kiloniella majae]|uniref:hypothetical protein n=1 Tax=Kiloniella majae TaxID=1938558 RepID=UPI0015C4F0D3
LSSSLLLSSPFSPPSLPSPFPLFPSLSLFLPPLPSSFSFFPFPFLFFPSPPPFPFLFLFLASVFLLSQLLSLSLSGPPPFSTSFPSFVFLLQPDLLFFT